MVNYFTDMSFQNHPTNNQFIEEKMNLELKDQSLKTESYLIRVENEIKFADAFKGFVKGLDKYLNQVKNTQFAFC